MRHLLERRRRQHAVVARRRGMSPSARGLRSSTRASRAHRHRRGRGRAPAGSASEYGLDEVTAGGRIGRVGRRPRESERVEDPVLERLLPRAAVRPRDDLTEEREGEVRVVPPGTGLQHLLGVGGPARSSSRFGAFIVSQISPGGSRWSPDACASIRPIVGACALSGRCCVEHVVERELARVAELHDPDGGERLRDRADPVLGVRRRLVGRVDVGQAERLLPHDLAVAEDGGRDRRQPLLGLRGGKPVLRSCRSGSGADTRSQCARNRLERALDVRVADVEMRDRAQHRRAEWSRTGATPCSASSRIASSFEAARHRAGRSSSRRGRDRPRGPPRRARAPAAWPARDRRQGGRRGGRGRRHRPRRRFPPGAWHRRRGASGGGRSASPRRAGKERAERAAEALGKTERDGVEAAADLAASSPLPTAAFSSRAPSRWKRRPSSSQSCGARRSPRAARSARRSRCECSPPRQRGCAANGCTGLGTRHAPARR